MAFPGTNNISYYKGDTHEFRIYPKNSAGGVFSLSDYGNATFKIAETRGDSGVATQVTAYASIHSSGTYITCAIAPGYGSEDLDAGTTYVYDVQVRKSATPYDQILTLITGTITVTDDVTQGIGEP